MVGEGAGVAVGGRGAAPGSTRVAMAMEIALATSGGRNEDGDHIVNTVAEARATRRTMPMWRTACTSDDPKESQGDIAANFTQIQGFEQVSCQIIRRGLRLRH